MESAGGDYDGMPILEHSTIDLGNQENARIWSEIEQYFKLVKSAGNFILSLTPNPNISRCRVASRGCCCPCCYG